MSQLDGPYQFLSKIRFWSAKERAPKVREILKVKGECGEYFNGAEVRISTEQLRIPGAELLQNPA